MSIPRSVAEAIYAAGLSRVSNEPPPAGQKFQPGTRVRLKEKYWYEAGTEATVEYAYAHAYGGKDVDQYSLNVDGHGTCAWFPESVLEFV